MPDGTEPESEGKPEEFKSIYDGYYTSDHKEMALIEKKKRKEKQAFDRKQKTGDSRHPLTIKANQRKAEASSFDNPSQRTNSEGNVINPADANACNQAGRYGSFSHGNNSCGCGDCT